MDASATAHAQNYSASNSILAVYSDEFKIGIQDKFDDARFTTLKYSRKAAEHISKVAEEAVIPSTNACTEEH